MKIEIERDTVQQALDALEYTHATNQYESARQARAITALREALAATQPAPQQAPDALHLAAIDLARKQAQRIAELEQQLAAQVPLTDNEWLEFWKDCDDIPGDSVFPEFLEIARIIEARYVIK